MPVVCYAQKAGKVRFRISKDKLVSLRDTSFITKKDTSIYLSKKEIKNTKVQESPYVTSERFYDTVRSRAGKSNLMRDMLDLVIKKKRVRTLVTDAIIRSEKVFEKFDGYTIQSISFKAVDLLEGSVTDTLQVATTKFGIFVNKMHRDTRSYVIDHNLLFKVGDKLDPYLLADNERILRTFPTLRDARILVRAHGKSRKTVDVIVVTQDIGSIGIAGDFTSFNDFRFDLMDNNILGYAKQLQVSYFRNQGKDPENGYAIAFRYPNIYRSFIKGEIEYVRNYLATKLRVAAGRDFFTPETKYAGGIELFTTYENYFFENSDTLTAPYHENQSDVWFGRSFKFSKRANIITSLRLNRRDFLERPFVSPDSNSFFFNRKLLLGSITFTKRNYLKTSMIRSFAKTEDIPVGYAVTVLIGNETSEFFDRNYAELRGYAGTYFPRYGYVSGELALATFTRLPGLEDGILSAKISYFSNLFKIRKTRSRQFISLGYTRGFNRVLDKTLGIEGRWLDRNILAPYGLERFVLGVENVYFMPWYALGFRFALYHKLTVNMLTSTSRLFERKSFFFGIGAGIRMLNENFVIPTFSVDVNYFVQNEFYSSVFEVRFTTELTRFFVNDQVFKPRIFAFR